MAIHTQLPIYKPAYDLLSIATDYVQHMPRPIKAALGNRLSELCIDLLMLILRANSAHDKRSHLETLLERREELEILFRLCQDKKFISRSQYAKAIELTTSIGKQAHGWKKHYAASPVT